MVKGLGRHSLSRAEKLSSYSILELGVEETNLGIKTARKDQPQTRGDTFDKVIPNSG